MGIAMLSTTEALEGKGQWHKQEIPCYPTLKRRHDARYLNQETAGSPDTQMKRAIPKCSINTCEEMSAVQDIHLPDLYIWVCAN